MTALLLERHPALDEGSERGARCRLDGALLAGSMDAHGGLTLDDLITGVWEGLAVRDTVNCPVCQGPMASPSPAGREDPLTGACIGCGTRLS
jgi:hypothetical protein